MAPAVLPYSRHVGHDKFHTCITYTYGPYRSHTSCKNKLCIESHSTGSCDIAAPSYLNEIQKGLRLRGSSGSPPTGFEGAAPLAVSSQFSLRILIGKSNFP